MYIPMLNIDFSKTSQKEKGKKINFPIDLYTMKYTCEV